MSNHLHIVSFDVPYPVSHGGYFDLFYKLKALHETGTIIHLHCFEYGRGEQPELEKYCATVKYYPRKKWSAISASLPYIVSSRINGGLVENLAADLHPILLEGTHSTYILYKNIFPGRKMLYRLHNIEQIYYHHLQAAENNFLRKMYFGLEANLLRNYERNIASRATLVLTVSQKDENGYRTLFPGAAVNYLPLFHPYRSKCRPGKGNFILYHGNLSVPENEKAARFIAEILGNTTIPLVIAGRNPSGKLTSILEKYPFVRLVASPTDDELEELIRSAHINIVYSFNATGIKIKLLHALYSGRHCIANEQAIPGEDFKAYCHLANTETELKEKVQQLMNTDLTVAEAQQRALFLQQHFDNQKNAQDINAFLQ